MEFNWTQAATDLITSFNAPTYCKCGAELSVSSNFPVQVDFANGEAETCEKCCDKSIYE